MGSCCSLCSGSCSSEDLSLSTPVASCGCAKSACSCLFKAKAVVEVTAEDVIAQQIKAVLKVELANIEMVMQNTLTDSVQRHGVMPPIQILEKGILSPPAHLRTLTVRVAQNEEAPDLT